MRTKLVTLVFFCALLFSACEKEPISQGGTTQTELSIEKCDEALELLSIAVSKACNHIEFRKLIREETNKQFDFDYDVLYRFIQNKEINIETTGKTTIAALLESKIINEVENSSFKSLEALRECLILIKNVNISVPFQNEDWDPINEVPHVVFLPLEFCSKYSEAKCYNNYGQSYLIYKKDGHPKNTIITIGISERVDEDNKIIVNPYGFVLDPTDRILTADEAYNMAEKNLKSGKIWVPESIVILKEDEYFLNIEEKENNYLKSLNLAENNSSDLTRYSSSIVSTIPTPIIDKIHPALDKPASAYLTWNCLKAYATHYEIFRKYGTSGEWISIGEKSIYDNNGQPLPSSNEVTNEWLGNGGYGYFYKVIAMNKNTGEFSSFSNEKQLYAGWRKGLSNENLDKIMLSYACWNELEWLRSKLDLYVKIVKYNYTDQSITYPHIDLGMLRTRHEDNNGWLNPNKHLFLWDMSKYAFNYHFFLWERDGGGTTTFKMGTKFVFGVGDSVKGEAFAEIAYTVQSLDDRVGFLDIYNYTYTEGWTIGDGLSINPRVGSARVCISSN